MLNADFLYEQLKSGEYEKDDLSNFFKKSLPTLTARSHVEGVNLLKSIIEDNKEHWSDDNAALKQAIFIRDKALSATMVKLLKPLYDVNSLIYEMTLTQAIRNGQIENSQLLLIDMPLTKKKEHIQMIIARYAETEDAELKENLTHIFESFCENVPDTIYRKEELYSHILQHKSIYFIKYFCGRYNHVVQSEQKLFTLFALEPDTTNEMIITLTDAGAKLTWLVEEEWSKILANHKNYLESGSDTTFSILSLHKKGSNIAKEAISKKAVYDFTKKTLLSLVYDEDKGTTDSNTVLMLVRDGFLEPEDVLDVVSDMVNEPIKEEGIELTHKEYQERQIEFLCNHVSSTKEKLAILCILMSIKMYHGLHVFKYLSDKDDQIGMALFIRAGKMMSEFNDHFLEYVNIDPRTLEIDF